MPTSDDAKRSTATSLATGAVSSAVSGAFGLIGDAIQYKRDRKLIEEQRAYEQQMWNKQNAYNTPAAQVQRLKDAGLNPALMYGDSASTGNADAVNMQPANHSPNLGSVLNGAIANGTQAALAASQTRLNNAKASETEVKTDFDKDSYNVRMSQLFSTLGFTNKQIADFSKKWDMYDAQTQYYLAKKGFTDQLTNTEFWKSKVAKNEWKTSYNESVWSGDYFENVVKNQVADLHLKDLQGKRFAIDISNMGRYYAAQINHLNSQARLFGFQSQLAQIEFNAKSRTPGSSASNKFEENFDLQLKMCRSNLRTMSQDMFVNWMRYKMEENMFYWKGMDSYSNFLSHTYGNSLLGKHILDGFNFFNSKLENMHDTYSNLFKSFSDISNSFYETMPAIEIGN